MGDSLLHRKWNCGVLHTSILLYATKTALPASQATVKSPQSLHSIEIVYKFEQHGKGKFLLPTNNTTTSTVEQRHCNCTDQARNDHPTHQVTPTSLEQQYAETSHTLTNHIYIKILTRIILQLQGVSHQAAIPLHQALGILKTLKTWATPTKNPQSRCVSPSPPSSSRGTVFSNWPPSLLRLGTLTACKRRSKSSSRPSPPLEKLSEESDVFFTIGRATHDGFDISTQPAFTACWRNALVYGYMLGKSSSRCLFYQTAALLCRAEQWREVREVINPAKEAEVRIVAGRFGIEPEAFVRVCWWWRWVWLLFP